MIHPTPAQRCREPFLLAGQRRLYLADEEDEFAPSGDDLGMTKIDQQIDRSVHRVDDHANENQRDSARAARAGWRSEARHRCSASPPRTRTPAARSRLCPLLLRRALPHTRATKGAMPRCSLRADKGRPADCAGSLDRPPRPLPVRLRLATQARRLPGDNEMQNGSRGLQHCPSIPRKCRPRRRVPISKRRPIRRRRGGRHPSASRRGLDDRRFRLVFLVRVKHAGKPSSHLSHVRVRGSSRMAL